MFTYILCKGCPAQVSLMKMIAKVFYSLYRLTYIDLHTNILNKNKGQRDNYRNQKPKWHRLMQFYLCLIYIENQILESSMPHTIVWWRYIIFLLWQHGEENLKSFLESLKNFHPTIKFIEFSSVHLKAYSFHVYYYKSSISYSQALWLNRICS